MTTTRDGASGWDEYAPFYDWENARTAGRRDVPFWIRLAVAQHGRVLELGCGTGRIASAVGRAGVDLVGIDRSAAMLARARRRLRGAGLSGRVRLVRGDIRMLPFRRRAPFALVMAPYGVLQSLTRERDLRDTLASAHRILEPGGLLAIDLVPDLPRWPGYSRRVSLQGRKGAAQLTLIESVRQDRRRGLTHFDQEYVERRGRHRQVRRFKLSFRTVSVPQMARRLEASGFGVDAVLGGYDGGPWDERADVWLILARRKRSRGLQDGGRGPCSPMPEHQATAARRSPLVWA